MKRHGSRGEAVCYRMQRARASVARCNGYLLTGHLIELGYNIMFYVYRNSAGRKAMLTITRVSRADRRVRIAALRSPALYDRATRAIGDLRSVHGFSKSYLREKEKGERGWWGGGTGRKRGESVELISNQRTRAR